MALWITQHLDLPCGVRLSLMSDSVTLATNYGDGQEEVSIPVTPESGDEATSMAIAFRLAAKRLEEIGKGF